MERRPAHLQETLAALAAPKRFDLLVLMLSEPDRSVSQLAEAVGLSQSCTTRHLQSLARAGLVNGLRDGKRVVFRIAPRDAAARAVIASLSGAPAAPAPAAVSPRRPRRSAKARVAVRPRAASVVDAAIRIESAAELEPITVEDEPATPGRDSRPATESDRNPAADEPAWRRSDLDDFLL